MRGGVSRTGGYVGKSECGNYILGRNGTCLKCDTGGGTTGCRLGAVSERQE